MTSYQFCVIIGIYRVFQNCGDKYKSYFENIRSDGSWFFLGCTIFESKNVNNAMQTLFQKFIFLTKYKVQYPVTY